MAWGKSRPYATDMAGFAVSLPYLLSRPSALFPTQVSTQSILFSYYCLLQCKRGHLESEFLKHLVNDLDQLEVASNQVDWMPHDQFNCNVGSEFFFICHQVLVWHTRTEPVNLKKEEKFKEQKGHNSDQGLEV